MGFGLEIARILALSRGLLHVSDELAQVEALVHDQHPPLADAALARALRLPMEQLGHVLQRDLLADSNPLLAGPFHRLLLWQEARHLVEVAESFYQSGAHPEPDHILALCGRSDIQRMRFVETVIALVWADGRLDPLERRMMKELIAVGRFDKETRLAMNQELRGSPRSLETIAGWAADLDASERRFLLEQLIFASLVDGEIAPEEEAFLESLGGVFGVERASWIAFQLELVQRFEDQPELITGLSIAGLTHRLRRRIQHRVESVVRDNLEAIVTEVKETGDLANLLFKATHSELTPEEMARVRAQLLDICKTVPALALLVVPGGTIIVPILIKILPFNMMPSAFEDKDEAL